MAPRTAWGRDNSCPPGRHDCQVNHFPEIDFISDSGLDVSAKHVDQSPHEVESAAVVASRL